MQDLQLTERTVIAAETSQVSTELDGEAIILNLKDGMYYGLDPVGARIWNLIQEPQPVGEVLAALVAEYEVEPEVCREEVLDLLQKLSGHGLLRVVDEAAA